MRSGTGVVILRLTGGECGKVLEVYGTRDWWCDVGTYGMRKWKDIGVVGEQGLDWRYWDVRYEEVERYWSCRRTGIGLEILGRTV